MTIGCRLLTIVRWLLAVGIGPIGPNFDFLMFGTVLKGILGRLWKKYWCMTIDCWLVTIDDWHNSESGRLLSFLMFSTVLKEILRGIWGDYWFITVDYCHVTIGSWYRSNWINYWVFYCLVPFWREFECLVPFCREFHGGYGRTIAVRLLTIGWWLLAVGTGPIGPNFELFNVWYFFEENLKGNSGVTIVLGLLTIVKWLLWLVRVQWAKFWVFWCLVPFWMKF